MSRDGAPGWGTVDRSTYVPLTRLPASQVSGLVWREFAMPKRRLAALAAVHCEAAALLQFARAPFALQGPDDWVLGDLRFDRGQSAPFSITLRSTPETGVCPWTPPWVPPRQDMLAH